MPNPMAVDSRMFSIDLSSFGKFWSVRKRGKMRQTVAKRAKRTGFSLISSKHLEITGFNTPTPNSRFKEQGFLAEELITEDT
jgi:hypothetical protein